MAILDHGHHHPYTDDYRAYLISQNQSPIAWDNEGAPFKRIGALAHACLAILGGWSRALYRAIYTAKCRRLQRDLMWYGIPYSHLLEDNEEARTPDAASEHAKHAHPVDVSAQVRIPVFLDQKWD